MRERKEKERRQIQEEIEKERENERRQQERENERRQQEEIISEKEQENEDADTDFNKQDDGKLFYSFLFKIDLTYYYIYTVYTCTYI